MAADVRHELAHDLAYGRGEDVDAADDQHVVGPADAADPGAGAAAGTGVLLQLDVVARAEAEEGRRAVPEMGEDEFAGLTVGHLSAAGVDELRVHEAAGAQVHAVLLLAFAPERYADVADPHRLRHLGAPALLELLSEGRLPPAGPARHEHPLDARVPQIRPLEQVGRIRGREHRGL